MDAVEEVKSRLNIEDVVGEYVELKRAGRNFKGLSPFSSEKSPSFMVSPEKGIWHDFSSGKGGTMFTFVMEMEGLTFKEALELLARKAGVDLTQFRGAGTGGGPNRERLYQAVELAVKFYQVQFSQNPLALEYALKKRQFSKETALEWQLGYAPNNGSALCDFLVSKKFTPNEIKDAGLSAQRYRGLGDMFRGRLMIPLHDPQGRPIGFTARLLEDVKDAPKYINTPQTPLYDKSRHVYGLHLAKDGIRKSGYVVLVEGNLDVISSHQAGVRQVVATAGTAMTEQHLKALSKFTGDIRLSFDQDKAGINATERAIPIASKVGVSLSMITIPSGKDPDELIKQDKRIWQEVIEQNQYALDWLIERYQLQLDLTSAQGKRQFSDVLLPVVRGLADKVEQDHYLKRISELIGVRQEALTDKYEQTTKAAPKPLRKQLNVQQVSRQTADLLRLQNRFLSLMFMQPGLRGFLHSVTPDMVFTEDARKLLAFLKEHPDFTGREVTAIDSLRPVADYAKIMSVAYEELYGGLEVTELQTEAARQQTRLVEAYVKSQKSEISHKLATADDAETRHLLEQVKALDQLLTASKGGFYG
ncbi:MAG TPA: DNA primase [Candidatus Limnocylindrales bacterium]|nr:DNA primase [Candidatus Limnocylindrales bacterium]